MPAAREPRRAPNTSTVHKLLRKPAMHRDIVISKYGPASSLELREVAARAPGDDEVAIDVAYSGVNFADVQMRIGLYPDAPKKPFVPGYEVSGTIAQVGKAVRDL